METLKREYIRSKYINNMSIYRVELKKTVDDFWIYFEGRVSVVEGA